MTKSSRYSHIFFTLASFIILIDFAYPGKKTQKQIIKIQKEVQQYYNAARNYHYSYKVITSERDFLVSEDFTEKELTNKIIEYSVSPIFNKVNWYKLVSSKNRFYHSLRIVSGFVLPLLTIFSIFLIFRHIKKISKLVFILKILLILDLVFLMS